MKIKQPKEHRLTEADVLSITGVEAIRGTARFFPSEEVTAEFAKTVSTSDPYMKIIDALYTGDEPPVYDITFNEGYTDTEDFADALFVFLMAHMNFIELDSDLRILGLTYLLKQVITIGERNV